MSNNNWCLAVLGALAFSSGVVLATLFWWCARPSQLVMRWLQPLRDTIEFGFAELALQQRQRSQRDKLWARKQQGLWLENQSQRQERLEARMVAELRRLVVSGPALRSVPAGAAAGHAESEAVARQTR